MAAGGPNSAPPDITLPLRLAEVAINAITEMVSVLGEDEVYRLVNQAWCRTMELAAHEVVGRRASELFPQSVDGERIRAIRECLTRGQTLTVSGPMLLPHLAGRVFEGTYTPYGRDHAGVPCVVVVTRDISERETQLHRLQNAQAETRRLLDAFPGLIAEFDHRLVYTFANDTFLRVMKQPREAIVGHSVDELVGPERADEVRRLAARALAGEEVVYDRWHGPRCIQITLTGNIDARSGLPRYHGFGIDVSRLKLAERALIAARDEAESANRAKSQFLSHMSHELRTPLNAILGFAQVLKADSTLLPAQRQQTDEILRGARHLHKLINDALDLGSIEAGRLSVELGAVALLPLARDCLRLLEPLALERGVALLPLHASELDASVGADALRLRQVLLNLLGNAIKYNRRDGRVALHAERHGALLRIVVSDSGPGIAPEQLERLFVPFERVHDEPSAVEGTGIGLALSRRLMQAMGGQIGVETEVGVGSRFWIELPLHADTATPEHATGPAPLAARPAAGAARRDVLYIEDNPVNIVLMEAMLMHVPGLAMHSEAMPLAGLERAFALRPALILLDIQLPGLNGFEVLERLRADERTRFIPVVAVSANAMPDDVAAGRAAGFFDYLTKPLELSGLVATVERALTNSWLASAQS